MNDPDPLETNLIRLNAIVQQRIELERSAPPRLKEHALPTLSQLPHGSLLGNWWSSLFGRR